MNGYYKSTGHYRRLANLIEQLPMETRLQTAQELLPNDFDFHDWERFLTGAALSLGPQIKDGVSSRAWWEAQKPEAF